MRGSGVRVTQAAPVFPFIVICLHLAIGSRGASQSPWKQDGSDRHPFGYGLSYAVFSDAPPTVEPIDGAAENGLRLTTTVSNTADRDCEEVAELYFTPPKTDGAPRFALRSFKRLALKAGVALWSSI